MSSEATSLSQLSDSLNVSGRRMTPQRALVLAILEERGVHLDAETIWQLARARDRSLNLATVYRTLAVLKEMGLVEQRYFAREHKREIYESVHKPEHYHFTCLKCGEVIEFETPYIRRAQLELVEQRGFHFEHACVCFEGHCANCARKALAEERGA